ncbi:hypothetical protein H257_19353 [Aphanomyces astaci]|uniref:Uncharacterized protein n=1 Tax=Aphanomyces astaci TaxID=112090 RepID=W4FA81_APHAT|nr:hypothetical protein H257_19353 [Aphanomyces astaci]ETV63716.1 hypothetical protein H257_19353 [Aphanomyces astaci]|eukprot:XP_009846801.1 hypothetical protein H257_19353 [Aphanomyces astaci]
MEKGNEVATYALITRVNNLESPFAGIVFKYVDSFFKMSRNSINNGSHHRCAVGRVVSFRATQPTALIPPVLSPLPPSAYQLPSSAPAATLHRVDVSYDPMLWTKEWKSPVSSNGHPALPLLFFPDREHPLVMPPSSALVVRRPRALVRPDRPPTPGRSYGLTSKQRSMAGSAVLFNSSNWATHTTAIDHLGLQVWQLALALSLRTLWNDTCQGRIP